MTYEALNPHYYKSHPSGVECIDISEALGLNLGSAFQYVWRAALKHETPKEDLSKALWFIKREKWRRSEYPDMISVYIPREVMVFARTMDPSRTGLLYRIVMLAQDQGSIEEIESEIFKVIEGIE